MISLLVSDFQRSVWSVQSISVACPCVLCNDILTSANIKCIFLHIFQQILLSMCIFTMVAVTSERCQAICHPLRYVNNIKNTFFRVRYISQAGQAYKGP